MAAAHSRGRSRSRSRSPSPPSQTLSCAPAPQAPARSPALLDRLLVLRNSHVSRSLAAIERSLLRLDTSASCLVGAVVRVRHGGIYSLSTIMKTYINDYDSELELAISHPALRGRAVRLSQISEEGPSQSEVWRWVQEDRGYSVDNAARALVARGLVWRHNYDFYPPMGVAKRLRDFLCDPQLLRRELRWLESQ